MVNVSKLKIEALDIRDEMNSAGFFKRRKLRSKLISVLDEIEYQEGRLQYANRPYSYPPAYLPTGDPHKRVPLKHDLSCKCGCWKATRKQFIGI
ncbi:hypothetical protein [Paenibacillus sp. FSL L8-0708]|uniref:hypothetical protein n=1 Tax=Paenibacillus sp. FSL L8-0708 TaxID=2975311 RepID=UPI0030F669F9